MKGSLARELLKPLIMVGEVEAVEAADQVKVRTWFGALV